VVAEAILKSQRLNQGDKGTEGSGVQGGCPSLLRERVWGECPPKFGIF